MADDAGRGAVLNPFERVLDAEIQAIEKIARAQPYSFHVWQTRSKRKTFRLSYETRRWFIARMERLKQIKTGGILYGKTCS